MPPRKRTTSTAGGKTAAGRSSRSRESAKAPADPPPPPTDETPAEPPDVFGRFDVAEPANTADLAGYYGRLITVSRIRVAMLGDLLADEYKRKGLDALRRITYTATAEGGAEPAGEVPTALARLEMEERRTLERLLVKAAELGIKLREVSDEAKAETAAMTIGVLVAFAERLELDQLDPEVRRKMQLAVLDAKQQVPRQIPARR